MCLFFNDKFRFVIIFNHREIQESYAENTKKERTLFFSVWFSFGCSLWLNDYHEFHMAIITYVIPIFPGAPWW